MELMAKRVYSVPTNPSAALVACISALKPLSDIERQAVMIRLMNLGYEAWRGKVGGPSFSCYPEVTRASRKFVRAVFKDSGSTAALVAALNLAGKLSEAFGADADELIRGHGA